MKNKKQSPESEIKNYCREIISERNHWKDINQNGCNDPFWADGCNLNLVRNHILYVRKKLELLCGEQNVGLPEEYFLPVPPVVPDGYMANLNQKERVERLRAHSGKLVTKKVKFEEDGQYCFL